MSTPDQAPPSPWAQRLGYAGLIPFVGLAGAVWVVDVHHQEAAAWALLAYGATIASFIGALHWGLVMRSPAQQTWGPLGWGVLPSLVAWLALLLDVYIGLWLLAALLVLCYGVDRKAYPRLGAQGWLGMRLALTAVASISCVVGAVGLWA